jgi:hypothetical protein
MLDEQLHHVCLAERAHAPRGIVETAAGFALNTGAAAVPGASRKTVAAHVAAQHFT